MTKIKTEVTVTVPREEVIEILGNALQMEILSMKIVLNTWGDYDRGTYGEELKEIILKVTPT